MELRKRRAGVCFEQRMRRGDLCSEESCAVWAPGIPESGLVGLWWCWGLFLLLSLYLLNTWPGCSGQYSDILKEFGGGGKSRELRAQMGSWPAWTKRLEIGISREGRTEPQVGQQSERRTKGHAQAAAKVKARVLLLLGVDHQEEAVKIEKAFRKERCRRKTVHLVTRSSHRSRGT